MVIIESWREIILNIIKKVIKKYKGSDTSIYCDIRLYSDDGGLFCLWIKAN